jgi:poly(3-hydroxybutyrate) depolymerase
MSSTVWHCFRFVEGRQEPEDPPSSLHCTAEECRRHICWGALASEAEEEGYVVAAPGGYDGKGYYGAGLDQAQDNPVNLAALGERDVMNVLDRVRQEFSIDERTIYIAGQSMGGAGALHLGMKYRHIWEALAASAGNHQGTCAERVRNHSGHPGCHPARCEG